MAVSFPTMCSGTGNGQYFLIEDEHVGFVHTLMVLVVDPACIPSRFNMGGLLRLWKIEVLPLTEASEYGRAREFGQYFSISGSVIAQPFYTTARRCIWNIGFGVGNEMTDCAEISMSLCVRP